MDAVYAGGDVVRGGSTVILAMQDGRQAAQAIDKAMQEKFPENFTGDWRLTGVERGGGQADSRF